LARQEVTLEQGKRGKPHAPIFEKKGGDGAATKRIDGLEAALGATPL